MRQLSVVFASRAIYRRAARRSRSGMMPSWVEGYVGIPFKSRGRDVGGVDCWGLVWMVFRRELSIELPSYAADYLDACDRREIAALIAHEKPGWIQVPAGEERVGDLIHLRMVGEPCHVGIVVEPGQQFLHAREGTDSCREHYDYGVWKFAVLGFFRWP